MTDDRIVTEADVVTKLSHLPVPGTVAKLTAMISAKGTARAQAGRPRRARSSRNAAQRQRYRRVTGSG
jgi:hypothetical protein